MKSEIFDRLRNNYYQIKMHYSSNFFQKIFLYFILLLIALPPALGLIYIKLFGINLVFWDQWELVPLIEKLYNSTLTLGDLFSQHNEHRIFFPRIIMLILAFLTHYNTIVEMYFSWILVVITLLIIYRMYRKDFGNSASTTLKFIPIIWLLFSFRQFDNIIWGWQFQIYLCGLGFVSSIYMLEKAEKINYYFFMAIFSGVISTFSFTNGLLVWPVGLIYIILSKIKNKRTLSIAWAITGIIAWIIFFDNWIKPSNHPSVFFALENIGSGIAYLIMNIGAPLAFEMDAALSMGFILLILIIICMIFIVKNKAIHENAKWIAFILFSLTSSLSMTIGRSGFGVEQGLSSRYVTINLLGIVGLYLILVKLYERKGDNKNEKYAVLYGMILSIILVGIISGYAGGIRHGEFIFKTREPLVNELIHYDLMADESLEKLYPNADIVRERIKILEKYGLNVFHNIIRKNETSSMPDWTQLKYVTGGIMSIDFVDKNLYSNEIIVRVDKNRSIYIKGWGADNETRDGYVNSYLVLKNRGNETVISTRKMLRPDVANYFSIESYLQSGWVATIRSKEFEGCFNISVRILKANGNEYYELKGNKPICFY